MQDQNQDVVIANVANRSGATITVTKGTDYQFVYVWRCSGCTRSDSSPSVCSDSPQWLDSGERNTILDAAQAHAASCTFLPPKGR